MAAIEQALRANAQAVVVLWKSMARSSSATRSEEGESIRGREYILSKQLAWARGRDIELVGSRVDRGRPCYTPTLEQNLFAPLLPDVEASFLRGSGGELGGGLNPGKMQALHSSSALGVNVFQYWITVDDSASIAAACGLCRRGSGDPERIEFEAQYPIDDRFAVPPNLDVVIHNRSGARIRAHAIECKFSEAYGSREHAGLKPAYLGLEYVWGKIPALRDLAVRISPTDAVFELLHGAQLIKHILGLTREYGHGRFRLLYLWYDVLGPEGVAHRRDVEHFASAATSDGVLFHALTYQELVLGMARTFGDKHEEYVQYLTDRYV